MPDRLWTVVEEKVGIRIQIYGHCGSDSVFHDGEVEVEILESTGSVEGNESVNISQNIRFHTKRLTEAVRSFHKMWQSEMDGRKEPRVRPDKVLMRRSIPTDESLQ